MRILTASVLTLAVTALLLFLFFGLHTRTIRADELPLYMIAQDVSITLDKSNTYAEIPSIPEWAAIKDVDECVLYCETGSILYNINGDIPVPTDRGFHLYAQEVVVLPKAYLKTTKIILDTTYNGTTKLRFMLLKKYPYNRRH